jgi:hypothetical protein
MSPSVTVRNEAERWIHGKRQRSVFSFEVVCETLELSPAAVRKVLAETRDKARGGRDLTRARFRRHPGRRRDIDPPDNGTADG